MAQNVGSTDRMIRIVLGAVLAAAGLAAFGGLWGNSTVIAAVLVLVGLVLLGTGFTQQCLIYRPFGIDTSK